MTKLTIGEHRCWLHANAWRQMLKFNAGLRSKKRQHTSLIIHWNNKISSIHYEEKHFVCRRDKYLLNFALNSSVVCCWFYVQIFVIFNRYHRDVDKTWWVELGCSSFAAQNQVAFNEAQELELAERLQRVVEACVSMICCAVYHVYRPPTNVLSG